MTVGGLRAGCGPLLARPGWARVDPERARTAPERARVDPERGSASLLMVGIMAVVVVFSGVALVVAGYLIGFHRARGAADLSALSAAAGFQQGEDGCAQARAVARRNGARVTRCDRVGDEVDFVVTVRVAVDVRTRFIGLPKVLSAVAHAEPL